MKWDKECPCMKDFEPGHFPPHWTLHKSTTCSAPLSLLECAHRNRNLILFLFHEKRKKGSHLALSHSLSQPDDVIRLSYRLYFREQKNLSMICQLSCAPLFSVGSEWT